MNNFADELKRAAALEYSLRIELRAARETTNCGAPMHIEEKARRRWTTACIRLRKLQAEDRRRTKMHEKSMSVMRPASKDISDFL